MEQLFSQPLLHSPAAMIASFAHNFIFIRTRKTASTSTEIVLARECGPQDIVTPVGVDDELIRRQYGGLPKNFCHDKALEQSYQEALQSGQEKHITRRYREIMKNLHFHHHMSAREMKALLPEGFWQGAFKFAVDRHPYEKVVSLAFWRGRNQDLQNQDLLHEWIERLIGEEEYRNSDLYLIDGQLAVDRLLRYENLAVELAEVARRLGMTLPAAMPRAKGQYRTDRRTAVEILTDSQKRRIRDVCAREFDLLGYSH